MLRRPEKLNGVMVPYDEPVALLLEKAQRPSSPERWAAFKALACNNSIESIDGLIKLYKSEDNVQRRSVVDAIRENKNGSKAANIILKSLDDTDMSIVRAGIEAVGKIKLTEANKKIIELLKGNDAIQRASLSALKKIWQPSNFDSVFFIFKKSKNDSNRKEACWTLRATTDVNNWGELFEVWQYDQTPRHRLWACELISKFGRSADVEKLTKLLEDKDGHVRLSAEKVIKKLA